MTALAQPQPTVVVGVADMKVSASRGEKLITYALGSCLGITVYDPVANVGGFLHVMLPASEIDPAKAKSNPWMFVDTGVPSLFKACYEKGAQKARMIVKVAGGAHQGADESQDRFQIGKRNALALRQLLWKNGVMIKAQDVGGVQLSRTMTLDVGSGEVVVKTNGGESRVL
jgi:chemotaxis protein CheD